LRVFNLPVTALLLASVAPILDGIGRGAARALLREPRAL
jgi:hypothetical protein